MQPPAGVSQRHSTHQHGINPFKSQRALRFHRFPRPTRRRGRIRGAPCASAAARLTLSSSSCTGHMTAPRHSRCRGRCCASTCGLLHHPSAGPTHLSAASLRICCRRELCTGATAMNTVRDVERGEAARASAAASTSMYRRAGGGTCSMWHACMHAQGRDRFTCCTQTHHRPRGQGGRDRSGC